ncbi:MAG: helix-turn-helix domain-containing protein [Candidatus Shapirobacteria bacterium]
MRTYVPQISFISTPDTEKERLLYQTAIISSGFYQKKGFIITPNVISEIKNNCIIIPEVLHKFSQKYWSDATKVGTNLPIQLTDLMKMEMSKLKVLPVDNIIVNNFSQNWLKKSKYFWAILNEMFPKEIKWIGEVEVRITIFGGMSSFGLLTRQRNQKLIIHLRTDSKIDNLAWGIISSLFWPQQAENKINWNQRMAIVDYIMQTPTIKKLFPYYKPSKNNERITIKYQKQSLDYCRSLGIYFHQDIQQIVNSHNQIFGTKELKILNKLIESSGELVPNDDLADILWGEDNFFSYWAINKMVQRIRKKLSSVNLKPTSLITVRGRGYKWVN